MSEPTPPAPQSVNRLLLGPAYSLRQAAAKRRTTLVEFLRLLTPELFKLGKLAGYVFTARRVTRYRGPPTILASSLRSAGAAQQFYLGAEHTSDLHVAPIT